MRVVDQFTSCFHVGILKVYFATSGQCIRECIATTLVEPFPMLISSVVVSRRLEHVAAWSDLLTRRPEHVVPREWR